MALTIFNYFVSVAKQKDNEQSKKKKQRSKSEKTKKQMAKTNKRITRTYRMKTKYGVSCIQSNRFVSLIKDIVASIVILWQLHSAMEIHIEAVCIRILNLHTVK